MNILTINNLEKLKYRIIDGYEVRDVGSVVNALESEYGIHAFNVNKLFTSLFIIIHRHIHKVDGVKYVPIRLKLVGAVDMEKCYYILLSEFEDMDGWIRVIQEHLHDGANWKRPDVSGVRTWIIKS